MRNYFLVGLNNKSKVVYKSRVYFDILKVAKLQSKIEKELRLLTFIVTRDANGLHKDIETIKNSI